MNAEEKKNPDNALVSGLESLWNRMKGRRLYIYGGIAALLVAVIVLLLILRRNAREADSQRWRELDTANTEEKLNEVIKSDKHQGRLTQTLARLDLARIYTYERGVNMLGTTNREAQKKAIADLEIGRTHYRAVVDGLKDNPMLEQEAWNSLALAEQILSAVPKEDNASEYRGSIAAAIEDYKKAAAIHPNSEPSKKYAKQAEEMAADEKKISDFYRELYHFSQSAGPPSEPPAPFFPPFGKDPGTGSPHKFGE